MVEVIWVNYLFFVFFCGIGFDCMELGGIVSWWVNRYIVVIIEGFWW